MHEQRPAVRKAAGLALTVALFKDRIGLRWFHT